MIKSAIIEGNYRYLLRREWDINAGQTTFVMLNPSTADAVRDDRTLCGVFILLGSGVMVLLKSSICLLIVQQNLAIYLR